MYPLLHQETAHIFSSLCILGLIKVVCFVCQQLLSSSKIIVKEMNCCSGIQMGKHLFSSTAYTNKMYYLHSQLFKARGICCAH